MSFERTSQPRRDENVVCSRQRCIDLHFPSFPRSRLCIDKINSVTSLCDITLSTVRLPCEKSIVYAQFKYLWSEWIPRMKKDRDVKNYVYKYTVMYFTVRKLHCNLFQCDKYLRILTSCAHAGTTLCNSTKTAAR